MTTRFAQAQQPEDLESGRFVRGDGRFCDDIRLERQAFAAFLRSPVAHAEIRGVEKAAASVMPGVLGVFTGADLEAGGLGAFVMAQPPPGLEGNGLQTTPRPCLAVGRVRHIGEPIAMVVAESRDQAENALEQIDVDMEVLDAVTDPERATADGAPRLWDAPDNICFEWSMGDDAAVAAAMEAADHVTSIRVVSQRVAGATLETRAAIGDYDTETGRYTLYAGTQGTAVVREGIARQILKIDPSDLRVITPDVGGGFGLRTGPYPEYGAVLFAAKALGRPVGWAASRSEAFISDAQCRDSIMTARMAMNGEGRIQAVDLQITAPIGAYLTPAGAIVQTRMIQECIAGPYRTAALHLRTRGVFTNTLPVGPYRGAGRPESAYILERLIDTAARETDRDRAELRRLNLLATETMPHTTPLGIVYDSGDFAQLLDRGLHIAHWRGFDERRKTSQEQGLLRGIGLSTFLKSAGPYGQEAVDFRVADERRVEIRMAAQSTGQRHVSTFAHLVSQELEIPVSAVAILQGDSDDGPPGPPTVGSRTAMITGSATLVACRNAIERGKAVAGALLEADIGDIDYTQGEFRIAGTDQSIALLDMPGLIAEAAAAGRAIDVSLDAMEKFETDRLTFPNGCHICEVEIDPETGQVDVVSYVAVDDTGIVLNPAVVEGQIIGGVAQGLGQVALEHCLYDADGQILTGSFMDYAMPRADEMPDFTLEFLPVPSPSMPNGAKGAGEAGTAGALPTIMNAINDALTHAGAPEIDMPATPEAVWRALAAVDR